MVELLILIVLIVITGVLSLAKSLRFAPNSSSSFELERRAQSGDTHAAHELSRRVHLPMFIALQKVGVVIVATVLVTVAFLCLPVWTTLFLVLVLLALAEIVAAQGWLVPIAAKLQKNIESALWKHAKTATALLKPFIASPSASLFSFASKDELRKLIEDDQSVLQQADKARLLGSLDFAQATVEQHMVARKSIITVGANETVGPVLLDRLHKAGHNIFVVVSKDLEHVKGLLYMSDLVPLDPEIKTIKDATRPKVHYVSQTASLQEVITVSLKTGRQFFLVRDGKERVVGLITLKDALKILLSEDL